MKIARRMLPQVEKRLLKGKAVVLYGARQVGKTTLMQTIFEKHRADSIWLNCDELEPRELMANVSKTSIEALMGMKRFLFLDEAQRIKNIGLALKIFVDNFPDKQVIATGSSSFDLANEIAEPLTGRAYNLHLYPFSLSELEQIYSGPFELEQVLETRLVYGMYPDVVVKSSESIELLNYITSSYLFKDIFTWQRIKNPEMLINLLKALALQLGNEVSFNELANTVGVAKETIMNYINLLEKAFVIFRLQPLSRNSRNEIGTSRKIYFYDNGIRNAIINSFKPLSVRDDVGPLWENFMISERIKRNAIESKFLSTWFWRTYQQQEVDYIEEYNGEIRAYEFKWKTPKNHKFPSTFLNQYNVKDASVIHSKNFRHFLLD